MKPLRFLVPALFLVTAFAQTAPVLQEVSITAEPSHHLVLENEFVRVFRVEVPAHAQTLVHRHDHDYVFVTLGDAEVENTVTGKAPIQLKLQDGDTRFLLGGFSHTARNLSDRPFRNITIEFLRNNQHAPGTDYAPSNTPSQKVLFIQNGVRVSEIRLAPGAALPRHEHKIPHLVVAVSDLDLRSDDLRSRSGSAAKPPAQIHQKAGDIKWVPAGAVHTLTNTGTAEALFITLEFQ
jgi:quercetin dioxygenase-like cupin family protein